MKKIIALLVLPLTLILTQCKEKPQKEEKSVMAMSSVKPAAVNATIDALLEKYGDAQKFRIERGVKQAAALWMKNDGSKEDFKTFCLENFVNDEKELDVVFQKLSSNMEILLGNFNKMSVDLKLPLHLNMGELHKVDMMFGSYDASAHMIDDFYKNKIGFYVALNFPFYTLQEKKELGPDWNRKQWAYARMGDVFISRVPADLILKFSEINTNADTYISEYNIYMGNLVDDEGKTWFPADKKLISHWGLRDELKSWYGQPDGLIRQKMIYDVMKRIISQEIPVEVINKNAYQWNPVSNELYKDGEVQAATPEPNTRYEHLLNNFKALKAMDPYNPHYPTYIQRNFDEDMEMSQEDIEKLFIEFISSPQVKKVAALVSARLGRKLEPFDIWYDGFKSRSSISEADLDRLTKKKYPTVESFEKDLPAILVKLGWSMDKAKEITSKIKVDPSRGAGHAWGATMKSDKARLRTRVDSAGMNYKGYNIAMHEFGHTVEQTISLNDVDYYMLNGVPNTAFTEALAFVFQARDLEMLGKKDNNPNKMHLKALDNFWSNYEIMGVSLVDMNVWKWLYENTNATPEQLKEKVISTAIEVWNQYYADVFGIKDQPILAIYSHMIDAPLYLSAYPVGHIIDFQIEKDLEGKIFANETTRMFTYGSVIPQVWMKHAVGEEVSIMPTLDAVDKALKMVQ